MGEWTFFSNYGHVLVCLARNREARLRDVAADVGITERAVQKIVRDMQEAGFITITKQGRCNRYRINRRKALRHGLESHCSVGKLLTLVARSGPGPATGDRPVEGFADTPRTPSAAADKASSAKRESSKEPPARKAPAKKAADSDKEKSRKPAGVDVRQQGSLF